MYDTLYRRLLVIDDTTSIHDDIRKTLGPEPPEDAMLNDLGNQLFGKPACPKGLPTFEVDSAYQGQDGLEMVQRAISSPRPYSVAFVDVRMPPGWDGVETVRQIWRIDSDIQIVLCTAYSDYSIRDIIDVLGATDRLVILKKPFDPEEAALLAIAMSEKYRLLRESRRLIESQSAYITDVTRVMSIVQSCHEELEEAHVGLKGRAGTLANRLQQRTVEMLGTRDVTVFALAQLAESRDPETGEHLQRMRAYSQTLAKYLAERRPYADQIDENFLENFSQSTPLHDIGKVGVPDQILLKPGPLTHDEFRIMQQHVVVGAEALEKTAHHSSCGSFLAMAAEIARYHHERFDGAGYLEGLQGEQIPLSARIVALADVFDALTSKRVYKEAIPSEEARELIQQERGKHFDPVVIDAFLACYDEFLTIRASIDSDSVEPSVAAAAADPAAICPS